MINSKERILIVTNLFPNPQEPIRGIFIANLVKELQKKCNLIIVCPLPWFPRFFLFKKFEYYYKFALIPNKSHFNESQVFYPKFFYIPGFTVIQPIMIFFAIIPLLFRLKLNKSFDLINAHWIYPDGIAAALVKFILNVPLILTGHGCDINLYTSYMLRRPQIKMALRYADMVTVVSNAHKKKLAQIVHQVHVKVIHNGVDFDVFRPRDKKDCRIKLNIDINKKIILFVGQLIEVKGISYLIEAANILVRGTKLSFEIKLIGEGSLRSLFESEVKKNKLCNGITFLGEKPTNEVALWFGACDVFCLPSIREGCPSVILESLASGRPVVASNVGGIPELVNAKNGRLFNRGDVKGLANFLNEVLNIQWNSNAIRNTIKEHSWENVADNYFGIYKDVLRKVNR